MKQEELIALAEETAKEVMKGKPGKLVPADLLKFAELLSKEVQLQSMLNVLEVVKNRRADKNSQI